MSDEAMKHTPGPWVIVDGLGKSDEVKIRIESEPTALDVCTLSWFDPEPFDRKQLTADARLIAASPELLSFAALVARMRTEDEMEGGMSSEDAIATVNELVVMARSLVAKAEGRS